MGSSPTTRAKIKYSVSMQKLKTFILESYDEMKNKVSWPKYSQLQNQSILVLIASLIFALFIGLIDFVFESGMDWIYTEFK